MSHWGPLRKAAHRGIRHYGNGMARLEGTLSEMANEFVTQVTTYKGEAIDLSNDIYNFVLKVSQPDLALTCDLSQFCKYIYTSVSTLEQYCRKVSHI